MIKVAAPTADPIAGTYVSAQNIELLSTDPDDTIYYTTDGSDPKTGTPTEYVDPIHITESTVIKAYATSANMADSDVVTLSYVLNISQVETPTADPVGAAFVGEQEVTLTSGTNLATIYYTTNGSTPTASSTLYNGSITISENATLKAIATMEGMTDSDVMTETYEITTGTVVNELTPDQMLSDLDEGLLTIDGSNPNDTATVTFNVEYIIQTDDVTITIPEGTEMTATDGSNFDMTVLMDETISVDGMVGAIKFGIPGLKLSFSKPIKIAINVGSQYNGKTLVVYYQNEGDANWTKQTTCKVADGMCSFMTDHATRFAAKDESSSKSSSHKKKKKPAEKRKVVNSKNTVTSGYVLVQSGKKFSRNKNVQLYFEKPGGGYYLIPMIVQADKYGSFSIKYKVNKPVGEYHWYAVDMATKKQSKKIHYHVK
jgi:hypothetical protein